MGKAAGRASWRVTEGEIDHPVAIESAIRQVHRLVEPIV